MEKYRFSKYNHFLKKKNKVVGINLFNRQFFAIDRQTYDLLLSYKSDLNQLQIDDPVLFSTMYKLGIIEDIGTDIPKILLMRNRCHVFSESNYRLFIIPTLNCNFSCWYCYETHPKKKMNRRVMENTIKHIDNIATKSKITQLHIDWFGGEPLLCYKTVLKPIAIATKEICINNKKDFFMTMTTNGFLIRPEMMPFFEDCNFRNFQITLDGYKDSHNRTRFSKNPDDNSYDTIVKNICLLANLPNVNVTLRINYTKEIISDCIHIIDSFPEVLRRKILISLVQVWQDQDTHSNDIIGKKNMLRQQIELQKTFKKAGFKIVNSNFENELSYTCYADLNNEAIINYDGRIFKCTAIDFEKEKEDGFLNDNGEIIWDENLLAKRIAKSTFDNEKCFKCELVPICTGKCSTNTFIRTRMDTKCILKNSIKKRLYDKMNLFYKQDNKLCHISRI